MLWIKAFHLLFVISWFAGLFYLPRLYVNLAAAQEEQTRATLLGMAERLYRFMTPLGGLALVFGFWLYLGYGIGKGQSWMHVKLLAVLALVAFHLACRQHLRAFRSNTNRRPAIYFRWFNEIPVLLLLLVLIMVVIKPF